MRDPYRFRVLATVVAVLAFGATSGRADVVPEKRPGEKPCTAPGQPCTTEGLESQPGTCVAATCTKVLEMHTRDGGTRAVNFPCFHCVAGGPGASMPPPKDKSSGCNVAPERGDTGSLAIMVLLIAGLIQVRRCGRHTTVR